MVEAAGIEPASVILRSQAYILSLVIGSRLAPAGRRLALSQSLRRMRAAQATKPRTGADCDDAALRLRSLAHQQTSAASSRY